jgi:hypothetical protein
MNTRTLFAVRTQRALLVTTLLVAAFAPRFVPAQGTRTFDSGSTGADGALTFAVPAGSTVTFDPTTFDPPLDPDGDNVFHFTTECFTTSGVEIGCADPFHPGQDGSFQLGCPRAGRFVVVDEETVADTCLGLLWKRRPIAVYFSFPSPGGPGGLPAAGPRGHGGARRQPSAAGTGNVRRLAEGDCLGVGGLSAGEKKEPGWSRTP